MATRELIMKNLTYIFWKFIFYPALFSGLAGALFFILSSEQLSTYSPQLQRIPLPETTNLPLLRDVYARNQVTRNSVKVWIEKKDWEAPPSFFTYGLPPWAYPWVNLDVGTDPIGHDLITLLGVNLKRPLAKLHYLEIGVSVGKCLFTQLQYFGEGVLVFAYDLEEVNPTFSRMLVQGTELDSWREEELRAGAVSQRRASGNEHIDTIKQFFSPAGGELRYLASDEYNYVGWARLAKQNVVFDLIYSDAFHTPEALLFEANQFLPLLNKANFAIVWDDCEGTMVTEAVCPILEKLRTRPHAPPVFFNIFVIGGWMGENEAKHHTCVATSINLASLVQQDDGLRKLERVNACNQLK